MQVPFEKCQVLQFSDFVSSEYFLHVKAEERAQRINHMGAELVWLRQGWELELHARLGGHTLPSLEEASFFFFF